KYGPKKGVWRLRTLKTPAFIEASGFRSFFLGKAGRDCGSGGDALKQASADGVRGGRVSRGARRIPNRRAPGRRPRCRRTRTARWPTADKKRSCPPRALLVLANSCGQMRTEAVIRGQNRV